MIQLIEGLEYQSVVDCVYMYMFNNSVISFIEKNRCYFMKSKPLYIMIAFNLGVV